MKMLGCRREKCFFKTNFWGRSITYVLLPAGDRNVSYTSQLKICSNVKKTFVICLLYIMTSVFCAKTHQNGKKINNFAVKFIKKGFLSLHQNAGQLFCSQI